MFRNLSSELQEAEKEDLNVTSSSGCDMSESFDSVIDSFSPVASVPRKLNFGEEPEDERYAGAHSPEFTGVHPGSQGPFSPPYKRVRALRLFDSPATPKTIIEKSSFVTPAMGPRSRLFQGTGEKPRAVPSAYSKPERHRVRPQANVNPFTPNGKLKTDVNPRLNTVTNCGRIE